MAAPSPETKLQQPYTVLARKYRSRTFDEVVGQEHVAQTLKKAIETGRVHHAYLFCGTRGVGKTSMARILALALNDPNADAPTPTPDPTTETADAIFKGDDVDVIEIDAASNTGVDNVRDLIENARFRPMKSRFKVYIIDEVHMLSKAAFNALLKIMEEPPGHVKFILATTEPERILPTILSRVQRFDFRNIPATNIVGHLREVVEKEGRNAEDDALRLVARNGAGSMRDSLSLLDRLISGIEPGGTLGVDDVTRLLGLPPRERVFDLVNAMGEGDPKAVLALASDLLASGQSADSLVGALIDHLHALLVRGIVGGDNELAEMPGLDPKAVDEQAARFEPASLSQNVAILEELRRQLRSSGAGRALLDATLVRLALASQFTSVGDLLAMANGNGNVVPPRGGGGGGGGGGGEKKTAEITAPAPPSARREAEASNIAPVSEDETANLTDLVNLWSRLRRAVAAEHGTLAPLLEGGHVERLDLPSNGTGASVKIVYPAAKESFVSMLERGGKKEKVAAVLADLLKLSSPPAINLRVSEAAPEPIASSATAAVDRPAAPAAASEAPIPPSTPPSELDLDADPLIQAAIQELGARVVKVEEE